VTTSKVFDEVFKSPPSQLENELESIRQSKKIKDRTGAVNLMASQEGINSATWGMDSTQ